MRDHDLDSWITVPVFLLGTIPRHSPGSWGASPSFDSLTWGKTKHFKVQSSGKSKNKMGNQLSFLFHPFLDVHDFDEKLHQGQIFSSGNTFL